MILKSFKNHLKKRKLQSDWNNFLSYLDRSGLGLYLPPETSSPTLDEIKKNPNFLVLLKSEPRPKKEFIEIERKIRSKKVRLVMQLY